MLTKELFTVYYTLKKVTEKRTMKRIVFLISIFFVVQEVCSYENEPVHFFIVIPTYRNHQWCIENIESVVKQAYPHWHACIIIDGSPQEDDGTGDALRQYIKEHPEVADKIILHQNTVRLHAMANVYNAVHSCPDEWVVVILDGDDALFNEHVLERLAQEYEDPRTWLTYGQFIFWPRLRVGTCKALPEHVIRERLFREYPWVTSHVRTFYAWLFKLIKKEDLLFNNAFLEVAGDLAIMFPMLEMASDGHIRFISDILYLYREHQANDCALRSGLVVQMTDYLRSKKRYRPLLRNPYQRKVTVKKISERTTTYYKLFPKKGNYR